MIGFKSRYSPQGDMRLTRGNTPSGRTVRTPDYTPRLHTAPHPAPRHHTSRQP